MNGLTIILFLAGCLMIWGLSKLGSYWMHQRMKPDMCLQQKNYDYAQAHGLDYPRPELTLAKWELER